MAENNENSGFVENLIGDLVDGRDELVKRYVRKEEIPQETPQAETEQLEEFEKAYEKVFPNGIHTTEEKKNIEISEIEKLRADFLNFRDKFTNELRITMQDVRDQSEKNTAYMERIEDLLRRTKNAFIASQDVLSLDMRDDMIQYNGKIVRKAEELETYNKEYNAMREKLNLLREEVESNRMGRVELKSLEMKQEELIEELSRHLDFHIQKVGGAYHRLAKESIDFATYMQKHILDSHKVDEKYVQDRDAELKMARGR